MPAARLDSSEITELAQLYVDDGCSEYAPATPRICTPKVPLGTHVACSASGACQAVP